MKTIQLAETVTRVLTKDRLELWILQSQSELQGSTVFIAIDGKILISLYLHICIIFHHNLQRYVLLKWDDKRESQNLSIGNVVKLNNPVAVGRQIFS